MNRSAKNSIIMMIFFILMLFMGMNVYTESDARQREYLKDYAGILKMMKENMNSAPKSGDVNIHFLESMISYRQGAAIMAENIIKYGNDKNVRKFAKLIIKEQDDSITEMSAILEMIQADPKINKEKEKEYLKEYDKIYNKMIINMEKHQYSENIDKDFLQIMILHNEIGIEMAKNISNYTEDKWIKNMAQNINKNQDKKIDQMKKILNKMD